MKHQYAIFYNLSKLVLILCCLLVSVKNLRADDYVFEHILAKNGEPIRNVRSLVKDKSGYLWFGGDEGLARYDGHELVRVSKEPTNKIFITTHGEIWSAGTGILTRFLAPNYNPSYYPHSAQQSDLTKFNSTSHVITTAQSREFFSTKQGISEYIRELDRFEHYRIKLINEEVKIQIAENLLSATQIFQLNDNQYLLGTTQGLFISDLAVQSNQSILLSNPVIKYSKISQILFAPDGRILVGSNDGIYLLNKDLTIDQHFPCLQEVPCQSHKEITKIIIDLKGRIWIGSSNGLYIIEPNSEKINALKADVSRANSISNNLITDLYQDDSGNVLVATYSGIDYFNRRSIHLDNNRLQNNQLVEVNNIWSIARDNQNQLWLGTFGGGLYRFGDTKLDTKKVDPDGEKNNYSDKHFSELVDRKNSLLNNRIPTLFKDSKGRLWVGTNNGLQLYDASTNEFISYPLNDQIGIDYLAEGILAIAEETNLENTDPESKQNNLWVTSKTGFAKINLDSNKMEIYNAQKLTDFKVDQWIRSILPFSQNKVLIGTDLGLHLFNQVTQQLKHLAEPGYVMKILKDSRGDIWILGLDGLYLFNEYTHSVEKMSRFVFDENLPDKNQTGCNAIVEDDFLQLWLVCGNGLEVFDLAQRQFIRQFSGLDGADMSGFLTGSTSLFKDSNGDILAGMRSGFLRWRPIQLTKKLEPPEPVITRIIYSDENNLNKSNLPFNFIESQPDEKPVLLPYFLQNIEFHFSTLSAAYSRSSIFQYRLLGYNKNWTRAENNNLKMVYNNLAANDYTFEVRVKYPDSDWRKVNFNFRIEAKPWLSWWAFCLYILLGYFLVTILVRFRTRRLAIKKNELQKIIVERTKELAISKDNIEHLMQEKERMIENIYHQTKTPLQLMLGNISFLNSKKLSLEHYSQKQTAEIFKLSRLTEQALTISKSHYFLQEPSETISLLNLLKPLVLSYRDIAEAKGLNYSWQIDAWLISDCQPKQIEALVENLLSNAVKYTAQGFIELEIRQTGKSYTITCSDSGIGIATDEFEKIFLRHSRAFNSVEFEGAGIGLAMVKLVVEQHQGSIKLRSEIGKGACFEINLPLINSTLVQPKDKITNSPVCANVSASDSTSDVVECDELDNDKESDQRPQILVVEDNIELATYLKNLLQDDYQVTNALNASDGLKKALEWVPDLILSDVMMGKMDGYQFCQAIRNNPISNHIPFLLLTAKSEPESRIKGFSVGANDFITKPFSQDMLLSRIANQIEHANNIRTATINANKTAISPTSDKLITRFLCHVEQNYQQSDLLIKTVSVALHVSIRQLERKVRYFIDMTPNEYLNEYRLLRAREFLRLGYPVKEVVELCGFSSPAYFTSRYKQRFNLLPSQEAASTTNTTNT